MTDPLPNPNPDGLTHRTRRMLLGCENCGANVLSVERHQKTHSTLGPLFTAAALTVSPVNVRTSDWSTHHHRPAADPWPTYSWKCSNCGRRDSRRHEAIVAAWPREDDKAPRVLRLRLGVDL
jgi:hypothetical protein